MLIEGLYTVESFEKEEQTVKATVKLNAGHEVFKGHFPGNPVMPGVCMIQIIKELTEQATEKSLFLSVASNIKFMAIINPEKNDVIQLTLTISEEDATVKVKNTTSFDDTLALKLSATFAILN
ncbi:3-hydroxyacyl-ACP dehydratase [Zobellia alginiliquefaciens]|uniref:3-hydroxyacyl-ACP dehydratase n=1 Tax=Zobellia alginiliquefaciens TaxID=3032586 RepID=UPI0023E406C7|nr:3-hydroxyacyl-ACP dehydratase [Zobellia alginiliquefaciens]